MTYLFATYLSKSSKLSIVSLEFGLSTILLKFEILLQMCGLCCCRIFVLQVWLMLNCILEAAIFPFIWILHFKFRVGTITFKNFISDQEFCTNNDANRAGLLCEGRVNAPRDNWTFLVRCCLHHCWASCSYLLRSALNRTEDQIILIYFDEPRFHSSWIASTKYFRLGCFLQ